MVCGVKNEGALLHAARKRLPVTKRSVRMMAVLKVAIVPWLLHFRVNDGVPQPKAVERGQSPT